ncbi:MAG TPA: Rieske 2Fe-2S domain-containing protein [Gemmatimonadaceae bacterium]|nr:Rieske 2Fe-2S domain-containing protein [Gemmatimonadaceae bacterium]
MNYIEETEKDCGGCPIAAGSTRRDFLRDAALGIAGIVASLGIARSAAALPVSMIEALARTKKGISYPIPTTDGVQIDKENEVILVRWQNAMYAFNLSCPHQRTALRWNDGVKEFQCPKHKSKYTPSGSFISGRATRGMDRFAIQREGSNVMVDVDQMFEEDENEAQWKAAFVKIA